MQRTRLIGTLKRALRSRGLTYEDVARHLDVSVATVKRHFAQEDLTLSRLEEICTLAGLELAELVETMASEAPLVSELTPEQERELTSDTKLLLMCYLLINRWSVAEITHYFSIEEDEAKQLLRRLRDLQLIEILPFDQVKVLTARNFAWPHRGPVHRYFIDQVNRDFFNDGFDQAGDALYVLGGLLSEASRRQVTRSIKRLAAEIDDLSKQDARLPRSERQAFGAVLALRCWEFSAFTALRRSPEELKARAAAAERGTATPEGRPARAARQDRRSRGGAG